MRRIRFFDYFGAKRQTAGRYPAPLYGTIVEPFAGAAGYSSLHYQRNVILCDLDETVIGTWQYLIRTSAAEILALPLLAPGQLVTDLDVCQEARWLIGRSIGPASSSSRPMTRPCKWVHEENKPVSRRRRGPSAFWGAARRARIAAQVDDIRHWRAYKCSYQDAPVAGSATWFIDPPYVGLSAYRHGWRGVDYGHLADWCKSRPGQAIVCEANAADWLPFKAMMPASTANRSAGNPRTSAELMWTQT